MYARYEVSLTRDCTNCTHGYAERSTPRYISDCHEIFITQHRIVTLYKYESVRLKTPHSHSLFCCSKKIEVIKCKRNERSEHTNSIQEIKAPSLYPLLLGVD